MRIAFKHLSAFLFILLQIQSCQRDAFPSENLSVDLNPAVTENYVMPKISADIVDLTENDALVVANIFSQSSKKTKSSGNLPVKDVLQ